MADTPFTRIPASEWVAHNPLAFAIRDANPVTPGHTLVITRRPVATWFDATPAEHQALLALVTEVKAALDRDLCPDGYNVGFNAGEAAGQTVMHLHVHVIPRFHGDTPDPRGGIRHVIPGKGNYLSAPPLEAAQLELLAGPRSPLGPRLLADLDLCIRADLAVAFILPSGLRGDVLPRLRDILRRPGSRVRVLTGDYQDVTDPRALRDLLQLSDEARVLHGFEGQLECRVFETRRAGRSFHPKAYLLHADSAGRPLAAYVGSSNLSQSALQEGVEWSLRLAGETARVAGLQRGFEALFGDACAVPLTAEWIRRYEYRRRAPVSGAATGLELDVAPEPEVVDVPEPHGVQVEALAALERTRDAGNRAALVVLATGLGKTWLAAFDSTEARGFRRVLFVAHREEILRQAAQTFARVRPSALCGYYTGDAKDGEADVVLASIQTLSRRKHLERFSAEAFDYIVIDEFHHADAPSYRKVLDYFEPRFLLGLTATPERADGGDLLALCQQNLAYQCQLARGIRDGHLAPFHYYGIADDAEYPNIPWRSLDEETLTNAVATRARAENALAQWRQRAGKRTVGFCVSRRHADFMRDFFVREAGLRAASVHSGENTDPRTTSLQALEAGELDVLFCVDMFNEGVDVPSIDTVLMLRPTESKVIWLQQLGRGLRRSEGKTHLTVIDYIGNHRVFLNKPAALLQGLDIEPATRREVVAALRDGRFLSELPPGCEVSYELAAIEVLEKLFPEGRGAERVREWYEEFREYNERRPSALEAYQSSFNPGALRRDYGSWLEFVGAMGDLDGEETQACKLDRALLRLVETRPATRSHELLVLQAMLVRGALPGAISLPDLAGAVAAQAARSGRLREELATDLADHDAVERAIVRPACERLAAEGRAVSGALFELRDGVFRTSVAVKSKGPALPELLFELVAWRLGEYLDRGEAALFKVIQNATGNPIVKLDRKRHALPDGPAPVTMGGRTYELTFAKEFVNVAREQGSAQNVLPALLRDWFGADAGAPGRRFEIRHVKTSDGGLRWEPAAAESEENAGEQGEGVQILEDGAEPVDARFLFELRGDVPSIVVMSRGGGRNDEYGRGLELLLRRLGRLGVGITSVQVESGATRQISEQGRTLELADYRYPVALDADVDLVELRKAIGRAGAAIGRNPGAAGSGNRTKRIRLALAVPAGVVLNEDVLRGGSAGRPERGR